MFSLVLFAFVYITPTAIAAMLSALIAVITGFKALNEINYSKGRYKGGGLAVVLIICGVAVLAALIFGLIGSY